MSRNSREPAKTDPDGSRRWIGYLDWTREDIIQGVLDLPEAERRTSRLPSGWSPIELLSHVLHMEQRWFVWGFLGERVASPWGDWSEPDPWESERTGADAPRWVVPADVTVEHSSRSCERSACGRPRYSRRIGWMRSRPAEAGLPRTLRRWSGSASTCWPSTHDMRATWTSPSNSRRTNAVRPMTRRLAR